MAALMVATAPADVAAVRELFAEYAQEADAPLCFAGFEAELAALPQPYASLLIAREGGVAAGCVALRCLDDETAEIKRLYVRPPYRGGGLGRALAQAALSAARAQGCRRVVLDSLPTMTRALGLYRSLGFREIAPYLAHPTPGARCFELRM